MPLVHPTHVVSFSSEDPNHPASNLLNRDTFRKWKCKEPGEKEAYVILKFDKAESFTCIDIGNDGAALCEVLVARSGNGDPQFEVLLSSSAFMSPLDSRSGKNMCGVKSYSSNSLCKPIVSQKWDLVKILVTQPFNRHIQYGLTFVKFTVAADPNEPQKIGIFGLRKPIGGDSDEEEQPKPGRLFADKMLSPAGSRNFSTAAAIKDTSEKLLKAAKSSTEDDAMRLLKKPRLDLPSQSPTQSKPQSVNSSPLLSRKTLNNSPVKSDSKTQNVDKSVKTSLTQAPKQSINSPYAKPATISKPGTTQSPQQRSHSNGTPVGGTSNNTPVRGTGTPKAQKKDKRTKPLNKLFEGVVFVISGIENPTRGQLRDKAVEMGGRYKADWDRTCTHLICAFVNTPKFRQVRSSGNGVIVKKDWIEKSYSDKCRYPWRRYCLDKNDKGDESEDEIHAIRDDNEEELLEDEPMQIDVTSKVSRKRVLVINSSDESENSNDATSDKAAYEVDTDVDDDDKTPDLSPSIMDNDTNDTTLTDATPFFDASHFYISPEPDKSSSPHQQELEKLVTRHKGQIHNAPTHIIEYYICHTFDWEEDFADALSDNPNIAFVHKNWLQECDKQDRMVSNDPYILVPN